MEEIYSNLAKTSKSIILTLKTMDQQPWKWIFVTHWLMLLVYLADKACDVLLAVHHHGGVSLVNQGPEGQSIKQAPSRKTSPVWRCPCHVVAQPHQVIRKWHTAQSGHFSIAGWRGAVLLHCSNAHKVFPWNFFSTLVIWDRKSVV